MLAGDVRVFQAGDNFFVRADGQDNQIEVVQTDEGDIRISGNSGTTINGSSEPLVLDTTNGFIPGGLRVNLGRGNDTMFVEGVTVAGRTVIYGGSGDDAIGAYNSTFMDDLMVQSFTGDDFISLDEVEIADDLIVFTLRGDDTIGVDNVRVQGNTYVVTGTGDDNVSLRNAVHSGVAYILTQSGNDFLGTDNLRVGNFAGVFTGSGSDDVFVKDSSFLSNVTVNGQSGNDRLEVNGSIDFAIDPTVKRFEGNDVAGGIPQTNQVFTSLISSGARLGTITELAALTPELSTLVGALQATGLDAALDSPGQFTAFAPLNSAFAMLPDGTLESLTTDELADILRFHVAAGSVFAAELVTLDSVDTLLGQSFSVDTSTGSVVLNGNVTLAQTDIRAKNGVIHLLNQVLLPA